MTPDDHPDPADRSRAETADAGVPGNVTGVRGERGDDVTEPLHRRGRDLEPGAVETLGGQRLGHGVFEGHAGRQDDLYVTARAGPKLQAVPRGGSGMRDGAHHVRPAMRRSSSARTRRLAILP